MKWIVINYPSGIHDGAYSVKDMAEFARARLNRKYPYLTWDIEVVGGAGWVPRASFHATPENTRVLSLFNEGMGIIYSEIGITSTQNQC